MYQSQNMETSMQHSFYTRDTIGHVFNSLASDRNRQFVDRLGWDLEITADGLEIDRYDIKGTTYVVIEQDGQSFGSCRLRPASLSTMIEDCFLDYLPGASIFLERYRDRLFELTRFCRSPDISAKECKAMLPIIGRTLEAFRAKHNALGFVAVVYPSVARLMRRNGVVLTTITTGQLADGKEVYMVLIGSKFANLGGHWPYCIKPAGGSHRESSDIAGRDVHACAHPLPHPELVELQRCAA